MHRLLILLFTSLVYACAGGPALPESNQINSEIQPNADLTVIGSNLGKTVRWGGQIVSIINHQKHSELQVLSYPLKKSGRPNDDRGTTGRFVLIYNGFLEPYDYASGKFISAVGTVSGIARKTIGDSGINIPKVDATQIHLWRRQAPGVPPFFSIGVGIGL